MLLDRGRIQWTAVLAAVLLLSTLLAAGESPRAGGPGGVVLDPPTFPIAVWLQAPRNASRYREIGINLYVGLWKGPTAEQIAELKRHDMPVVCAQNAWALDHLDEKLIVGWMHGDEPDNAQDLARYWADDIERIERAWPEYRGRSWKGYGPPVAPASLLADYRRVKEKDPSRPVVLNLGQGVAWEDWRGRGVRTGHLEDYPEYLQACDVASFDIYPVVHESPEVAGKLEFVPRGVDRLRKWTGGKKPVWSCIECTHIGNPDAKATPDQIRAEVWMAIVHGARGLIYFAHEFKPRFSEAALLGDAETARTVAEINRQIQELAPVLNGPVPEDVVRVRVRTVPKDAPVDLTVRRFQGRIHVFAVAMRPTATRASFHVQGGPRTARAHVLEENRTLEVKEGSFEDSFAPYGVHLYRIE